MKITYNWLRDFVEIRMRPQQLAKELTMAGLEVVCLKEQDGDYLLEMEITSNRPDWLSVIGIAREVAAITAQKLKLPAARCLRPAACRQGVSLQIKIEDQADCPLYTATLIRGVKVGPSPEWLKNRLMLLGCRSVNNIVDITNYVLFEYGQPLHAFDLQRLPGLGAKGFYIGTRRARQGEKIITLDGIERNLDEGVLVIASGETPKHSGEPLALAGIMGGQNSEVSLASKDILLEAAVFNPTLIRQGRRKLGVDTDSSYRFERGLDPQTTQQACLRARALIQQLCQGRLAVAKAAGLKSPARRRVRLDLSSVERVLGVKVAPAKIKSILCRLGFVLRSSSRGALQVTVPSFRGDVKQQEDLIEEIARIFGYQNIPASLAKVLPQATGAKQVEAIALLKEILVGLGLQEVKNFALVSQEALRACGVDREGSVEIANPLSREQEVLRPSLIPGLLRCLAYNLHQKQELVAIFEEGEVFHWEGRQPREEKMLGIALCGVKSWLTLQGAAKENLGMPHLKGIIETLCRRLGIGDCAFRVSAQAGAAEIFLKEACLGRAFSPDKGILDKLEIKNKQAVVAEIYLEKLIARACPERRFNPLPLYPAISRDLSIVVKEEISAQQVLDLLRAKAGALLEEARVSDYYRGKQIPPGFKGLTISCLYRSPERTLREEEVLPLQQAVLQALENEFGARLR